MGWIPCFRETGLIIGSGIFYSECQFTRTVIHMYAVDCVSIGIHIIFNVQVDFVIVRA